MEDLEATESEDEICFLPNDEGGITLASDPSTVKDGLAGKSGGERKPTKPRKARKSVASTSGPTAESPDAPSSKTKGQARKRKLKSAEDDAGVPLEGGAENGGGSTKSAGRRRRTADKMKDEGGDGLPGVYAQYYALYDAVDSVCCFLLKNSLSTSLETIQPILQQWYRGSVPFNLEVVQRLCHVSPEAIDFHYVPVTNEEGQTTYRLELVFPTAAGIGKGHGRRRREMVRKGLLTAAIMHHQQFIASRGEGQEEGQSWDLSTAWHPDFERLGLKDLQLGLHDLPTLPTSLAEAPSTDPYRAPPAPLVRPGTTGLARTSSASSTSSHREGGGGTLLPGSGEAGGEEAAPFNDSFVNNVPAADVPAAEDDCIPLDEALAYLQSLPFYHEQVAHLRRFPSSDAAYGQLDHPIPPALDDALRNKGVSRLFLHQCRAINAVLGGQHLCLSTATSSGKSLVYTLPMLTTILNTRARALLLFPTKALAQDQLRSLRELLAGSADLASRVSVETLDGDTPHAERNHIREHADVILSNPDMLHQSILPQHKYWEQFLRDLRYVVIDEAHMYTGVFGSHVAGVIRRLVRLCLHYGNRTPSAVDPPRMGPTFIACSATIANPRAHFAALVPLNVLGGDGCLTVVDKDTSPRGNKTFVIWNPPLKPAWRPPIAQGGRAGVGPPRSASRSMWRTRLAQMEHSAGHKAEARVGARDEGKPAHQEGLPQEDEGAGPGSRAENFAGEGGVEEVVAFSQAARGEAEVLMHEGDGEAHGTAEALGPLPADQATEAGDAVKEDGVLSDDRGSLPEVVPPEAEAGAVGESGVEGGTMAPWAPRRRSAIVETAMILAALVKQRLRTLAFCKVRKLVEMVLRYTLQDLHATAPFLAPMVKGYRGGYTKEDRREIERDLFGGKLLGVTATCALELGVDVGNLDVTLHMGFPGTISSLWQQAGRAGRAGRDSLSIMVCFETPVDQYFVVHPDELLDMPPEKAALDPFNQYALRGQLVCAADERCLGNRYDETDAVTDRMLFGGKAYDEAVDYLLGNERLCRVAEDERLLRKPGWITNPARNVNLRMIDPITFEVRDESRGGQVIDHVGYTRAFFELFEGAIYMHQARQYLVVKLDIPNHAANVRPVRVGYYTSSRNHTDVNLLKRLESNDDGTVSSGCAQVVAKVWGYRKVWLQTGKIFEMGLFSLPPLEYETRAFFIDLGMDVQQAVEDAGRCYVAGIHAVNHALLSVTPLFILCDPGDIDTEHVYPMQQRPRPPRIVVYDKRPGGIGAAESLFDCVDDVLAKARALVSGCPCTFPEGCPACIHDYRCSDYNVVLDKEAAVIILDMLIQKREEERKRKTSAEAPAEEEEVDLKITPRKAARQRGLEVARAMDTARGRDLRLQQDWVHSFPCYRPEG